MDEDLERHRAVSKAIGISIIEAFRRRFPDPRPEELAIIYTALTTTLISFVESLPDEMRKRLISSIICTLIDLRDGDLIIEQKF